MTETRAIINNRSDLMGITFYEVSTAVGLTPATLRKKCTFPELFTIREFGRIGEALKLSDEQKQTILREAIHGRKTD